MALDNDNNDFSTIYPRTDKTATINFIVCTDRLQIVIEKRIALSRYLLGNCAAYAPYLPTAVYSILIFINTLNCIWNSPRTNINHLHAAIIIL